MNDLIEKIKDYSIFYISMNPERALGLEKILPNFYIVSLYNSYIFNFLHNYYSLLKEDPQIEIQDNTYTLLNQKKIQEYINKKKNPLFMFFKITPNIELSLKNRKILNPSSSLNKKYENKINILKYFKDITPKSKEFIPINTNYNTLKKEFGRKFVIQFMFGHTGKSTFFIENEDQFNDIKGKYPQRFSKVSQFIEGDTYTINGVVTRKGILVFNLSKQITGIKNLTQYEGGTVGNDWKTNLNIASKEKIKDYMIIIGQRLKKDGYLGLFGADFVFDGYNIFLIEINPRENASVPTFTKIQIQNNIIPSKLIHILEFLDIKYNMDIKKENKNIFEDINFNQIIISSKN